MNYCSSYFWPPFSCSLRAFQLAHEGPVCLSSGTVEPHHTMTDLLIIKEAAHDGHVESWPLPHMLYEKCGHFVHRISWWDIDILPTQKPVYKVSSFSF